MSPVYVRLQVRGYLTGYLLGFRLEWPGNIVVRALMRPEKEAKPGERQRNVGRTTKAGSKAGAAS